MKTLATAFALLLVLVLPTSVLAWTVDTGKDQQTVTITEPDVTAKVIGPRGDPFYRFIVKVGHTDVTFGACTGWVRVPDAKWAQGTTFTVDGTDVAIGRGEKATLPAGDYVGRWSNSKEVERFTIRCDRAYVTAVEPGPTKVTIRVVGKNGVRKVTRSIGEGCTYRSPWLWAKGGTRFWVQDNTHRERLLSGRAAAPGYYGKLWFGYDKGISCPS